MYHQPFMIIYMGNIQARGIYSDLIEQYISYKRSLGFKMIKRGLLLNAVHNLKSIPTSNLTGLSKELFDEWSIPRPQECEAGRYGRIAILRQFSAFLQMIGYDSYLPKLPKYRSTFVPHIFTATELESIFRASDKLFLNRKILNAQVGVMPTLLRMLYATGIRLGEALNLKHKDVNLIQGYCLLRECKNGQDRLIPLSGSLIQVCKDYCMFKGREFVDMSPDAYFFAALDGTKCGAHTIYEHFRTVLTKAGIPHKGNGNGPRLHDLRHTFCVKSLHHMVESGMDLYHVMPILATYVGHKSIESTNAYIRLTAEMYPALLKKVNTAYKHIFPEMEDEETN